MPTNLTLSIGTLCSFFLVLSRVAGALVFVPIPGMAGVPQQARAALACALTLALSARWPAVNASGAGFATLAAWAGSEAAVGIAIGVSIAIVLEGFSMAAQALSVPAGYGFVSTIDPNTQADSGVLLVFAQLMAGLLFFSAGLDRTMIYLFAESLDKVPPGSYVFGPQSAFSLARLASGLFSVGVRLALPVVALLVMVDVSLALLGRVNARLQLLMLAFPAKMLVGLLMLNWLAVLFPRILREFSGQAWIVARRLLGL
jgi:flagellar biosynthesis protein FliR